MWLLTSITRPLPASWLKSWTVPDLPLPWLLVGAAWVMTAVSGASSKNKTRIGIGNCATNTPAAAAVHGANGTGTRSSSAATPCAPCGKLAAAIAAASTPNGFGRLWSDERRKFRLTTGDAIMNGLPFWR